MQSSRTLFRIALTLLLFSLPLAAQLPPPAVLIKNVTLFDGTGKPPQTGVSILVDNGRIKAIGAAVDAPARAQVIDGTGKYVVPGLFDARVQLSSSPANRILRAEVGEEQRVAWMHSLVAAGVTSARLIQGDLVEQRYFQHWTTLDLLNAPHLIAAGPTFTAVDGIPADQYPVLARMVKEREVYEIKDVDQAREKARVVAHNGGEAFEIVYDSGPAARPAPRLSDDVLKLIITEAHGHDLKVFVWVSYNEEALTAIAAGADVIEGISEEVVSDAVLAEMAAKKVAFLPSLASQGDLVTLIQPEAMKTYLADPLVARSLSPVMKKSLASEKGALPQMRLVLDERMITRADMEAAQADAKKAEEAAKKAAETRQKSKGGDGKKEAVAPAPPAPREPTGERIGTLLEKQQERAEQNVKRALAAGIPIVTGSGAGNPLIFAGPGLHRELALLVKAGMTPIQAITAATRNTAASMGKDADSGTIETGKLGDLVLLDADPLADIGNLAKINTVLRGGRKITPDEPDIY
ncbi:MAG TPA: amidohydrolase family protein [Terriglobales bacterium]|nr:amidohydrolase family protein [Terriglobales bacterium]